MRELIYVGKNKLEWHEAKCLTVRDDLEAIVRPIASTTCDLDRRILRGDTPFEPPFAIGHEAVGEVMDIGDRVKNIKPGDIVVIPFHIACGVCPSCRKGLQVHCTTTPELTGYGVGMNNWGGLFSEEVRVPFADGMLVNLPDGVDPIAVASASDNLTDAYISVKRAMLQHPSAEVLIVNDLESLGLFAADHALAAGAQKVVFVDQNEKRLEKASELGAEVQLELSEKMTMGFSIVVGASRDPQRMRSAMLCVAPGGHFSSIAIHLADTPLPLWDMYLRGVTFSIGMSNVGSEIPTVLELARCGHIHPQKLMSVHNWDDAPQALIEQDIKPVIVRSRLFS